MTGLIYILSPSYSGSTLLTFLLGAHPRIATMGELKATQLGNLDTYTCSCGALLAECAFWREVKAELHRRGQEIRIGDFGTHFRPKDAPLVDRIMRARVRGPHFEVVRGLCLRLMPACRLRFRAILERNRAIIEAITRVTGREWFLDGSKDPVRLKHLLRLGFDRVRVIHLIRDGRGTVNSFRRHEQLSIRDATLEWRQAHEECLILRRQFDASSWLQVIYEQMCARPDDHLDRMFRFIGVDPAEAKPELRGRGHHIIGNAMRLKETNEIKLDEKWRTALDAVDLATFEEYGGELNRRFGYTPSIALGEPDQSHVKPVTEGKP